MATVKKTIERAILRSLPPGLRRSGLTIDRISKTLINGVIPSEPDLRVETSWAVTTKYRRQEIDGEQIRQNDVKLLFQIKDGQPEPDPDRDWTVSFDNRKLRVESLEQVKPGGEETALFIAQLRR